MSLSLLRIRKEMLDNSGKQGSCLQSVSSLLSKRQLCQIFRVDSFHSFSHIHGIFVRILRTFVE